MIEDAQVNRGWRCENGHSFDHPLLLSCPTCGKPLHRESLGASIIDSCRELGEFLRKHEMVVVAHPNDLTDDVRRKIEATPFMTLRESRFVEPGKLIVIRPGLLEDLYAR